MRAPHRAILVGATIIVLVLALLRVLDPLPEGLRATYFPTRTGACRSAIESMRRRPRRSSARGTVVRRNASVRRGPERSSCSEPVRTRSRPTPTMVRGCTSLAELVEWRDISRVPYRSSGRGVERHCCRRRQHSCRHRWSRSRSGGRNVADAQASPSAASYRRGRHRCGRVVDQKRGRPGFSYPLFFGELSALLSFGKGLAFYAPGLILPIRRALGVYRL